MSPKHGRTWATAIVGIGIALALSVWIFADDSYSNIYPADYVGPDACLECHEDNHQENFDSWSTHSHRVMNQKPDDETVLGDFSGAEIHYGRGHAIFHRDGADFVMSIYKGGSLLRRHVVTRTVGSRYMQYYIGKQVYGPEPERHLTYRTESKLPFVYCFALQRWLPEIYLDSTVGAERHYRKARDYIYAQPPNHNWNISCLTCHNTYPYETRLWKQSGELEEEAPWKAGFPESSVEWRGSEYHQGRVRLGKVARGLHGDDLVTLGISCETCHFGGREHVEEGEKIRFVPTAPELTIRRPGSSQPLESDREDPFIVNSICAQCHNAQVAAFRDGSPAVNSSESTEMAGGACSSAIKCTDCHDPHEKGLPSGSVDPPGYDEACLKCHSHIEGSTARAAHTRHSESVTCLDCHMVRIVAGLDVVTRSHRITSPTSPRMIQFRGPNACNLCHLDRSIAWTVQELAEGWGYTAPSQSNLAKWYGEDLQAPVGRGWLKSSSRFVRLAALEAYARSNLDDRVPAMLLSLEDAHAFNRTIGLIALERVIGRSLSDEEYDLLAGPKKRAGQVTKLAEALGTEP